MRFEFSLREKRTQFGRVSDPKIDLPVKTPAGCRVFRFLVDTGSDFSMLPLTVADELGADVESAPEIAVRGIGRSAVKGQLAEITLMIGDSQVQVPCIFSHEEGTPFLLGRMGFFQRFNITFDNRRKKIVLEEIEQ